jgi:hypothetical protein
MCDRCEQFEERVEELEQQLGFQRRKLDTLVEALDGAGGSPTSLLGAVEDAGHESLIDWVDNGVTNGSVDTEVRGALLEILANWTDIREGRTEQFPDEPAPGGETVRSIHRYDSARERGDGRHRRPGRAEDVRHRAQELIAAEDTLPQSGRSITVSRVSGRMVRGANRHDCVCEDWTDCAHGLLQFRNEDGYQLAVDESDWREYLNTVVETIQAVETVTATDDEPGPTSSRPTTSTPTSGMCRQIPGPGGRLRRHSSRSDTSVSRS